MDILVYYAILGIVAGTLAGMLGIGGGVVIVPALVIILALQDFPSELIVISAVATSLSTIIFTSISAARAQIKRKAVDWTIIKLWLPTILLGSFLSGFIASYLPPAVLETGIAVFLLLVSFIMLSRWVPNPNTSMPGKVGTSLLGLFSGSISGLAGIGGGNVMVPIMMFFNIPMQRAVATSSALGFPLATVGAMGYMIAGWNNTSMPSWSLGYVYLPAVLLIAIFTMLFAPLGVMISHKIPAQLLKRCFGGLLFVIATKMLFESIM